MHEKSFYYESSLKAQFSITFMQLAHKTLCVTFVSLYLEINYIREHYSIWNNKFL